MASLDRRLLAILTSLLLATTTSAADFETLVDESIPALESHDQYSYWKHRVIPARVLECTSPARTTYYVDTGSTTGGDGTTTATSGANRAFSSMSDVNSAIAASAGGYMKILFKRGQTFTSSTAIGISKPGIWLGAYGAGAPPVLTVFRTSVSSGWTDAGDGAAYITPASKPGWIQETTSEFTKLCPFSWQSTLQACKDTARSMFWDSGTGRFYINLDDANLPGSITFRYSLETEAGDSGITIANGANYTVIEGLRLEGWGAYNGGSIHYGVKNAATTDTVSLVRDCEAYYCGAHAFGAVGGSVSTWQRCVGGYCQNGTGGTTTVVFYADSFDTADECIFDDCVFRFGGLRNATFTSSYNALHQGAYAHNQGNTTQFGLFLCIDCREPAETDYTNYTITAGDPYVSVRSAPGDGSPNSIRTFFINHRVDRPNEICKWGTGKKQAYLGCRWKARYPSTNTDTALYSTSPGTGNYGGTFYRCQWEVTDFRTSSVSRSVFPSGSITLDGCGFWLYGLGPGSISSSDTFKMIENGGTTTGRNCVIVRAGPRWVMNVNGGSTGNDGTVWTNLATFNVLLNGNATLAFDAVPGRVELEAPIYPWQTPYGTVLATGGSTSGYPLADANWRKLEAGQTRSIGAIETNPVDYDTLDTIAARIGPWTGDTAKNSVYGALRAMANADTDFASADLTKDDGDGAGTFNNEQSSLGGIRSITALAGLGVPDGIVLGTNGTSTTVFTLPATDASGNTISTSDNIYRDNELVFVTGANAGLTVPIAGYTGATRTVTLSSFRPANSTPQSGDLVIIRRGAAKSVTSLADDSITASSVSSGAGQELADALLDRTDGVETGWTLRKTLRVMAAVLYGKSSGAPGATTFRSITDTKARVTSTVNNGNRTAVTVDPD